MTSGAEIYILKIIKPLVQKCVFSATSTKMLTDKFKKIASKFTRFHEVITIDAVSLFTSINVPRVGEKYFSDNNLGSFPPMNIFKNFLIDVLFNFNSFGTLTLGSSKLFYSAEAPAPLKWVDFEPSLRINYIL